MTNFNPIDFENHLLFKMGGSFGRYQKGGEDNIWAKSDDRAVYSVCQLPGLPAIKLQEIGNVTPIFGRINLAFALSSFKSKESKVLCHQWDEVKVLTSHIPLENIMSVGLLIQKSGTPILKHQHRTGCTHIMVFCYALGEIKKHSLVTAGLKTVPFLKQHKTCLNFYDNIEHAAFNETWTVYWTFELFEKTDIRVSQEWDVIEL